MNNKLKKKVTIVIPAFNEANTINEVLNDILTACSKNFHEIILVDDGSTDNTAAIAKRHGVRVISHLHNRGYGASLKTGINCSRTEYILTMDSDGQHTSEDVNKLLNLADAYDMIVGERTELIHSSLWRMPGKWLLSIMANYLAKQKIPDLNSGLRVFKKDIILKYMHLCPSGFSFSTTITMTMFSRGYNIKYIPIKIKKRDKGKSTVSIRTGFDTIILILRIATLFDPLRIFIPLCLLIGNLGIVMGLYYYISGFGIGGAPILLLVSSVMIFAIGLLSDQISQLRLERYE